MRNLSKAVLSLAFALVLVVQLRAQSDSNYFVHEQVSGKYDLIKTGQNDTEIILRPDRIEIFKKGDAASGSLENSTYLVFGKVNKVLPQGRGLLQSSKERISDKYNADMAQVLQAEYMDVTKYSSIVYLNLFDGADLVVSLDKYGELVFDMIAHEGTAVVPFDLRVMDPQVSKTSTGFVSNGVELSSETSSLALKNGVIDLSNRKSNQVGCSFRLDIR